MGNEVKWDTLSGFWDERLKVHLKKENSVKALDDGEGQGRQVTAAEALLVKQRIFALPSTNALVVPLSRDDALVGLLVGEMPEGGGWKRHRESARSRAKRKATQGEVGRCRLTPGSPWYSQSTPHLLFKR